jgi:hypothetical protein
MMSGICLIPRGTLHEQLEYPLVKPLAKCIAYDSFVIFSVTYPFSPGGDFAVCLHHSALVDCAGGSTCVAVVAFPPLPAPETPALPPGTAIEQIQVGERLGFQSSSHKPRTHTLPTTRELNELKAKVTKLVEDHFAKTSKDKGNAEIILIPFWPPRLSTPPSANGTRPSD